MVLFILLGAKVFERSMIYCSLALQTLLRLSHNCSNGKLNKQFYIQNRTKRQKQETENGRLLPAEGKYVPERVTIHRIQDKKRQSYCSSHMAQCR